LESYDDERNILSLQQKWAQEQGVKLADGVQLVNNGLGDWGVGLSENRPVASQEPIMTIPKVLILSSKDDQVRPFHGAVQAFLAKATTEAITSSGKHTEQEQLDQYTSECLLMLRIIQEQARGSKSPWKSWLDTLPKDFSTGLYLDPLERSQVERVAYPFLVGQQRQFDACREALENMQDNFSSELQLHLSSSSSSVEDRGNIWRWVYSVVFTRSWRTAGGDEAILVPLGDMFNHNSVQANVAPKALDNGSMQLIAKQDLEAGTQLYLSYGLGNFPGRFLVTFGFWERSSLYMDANLTIPAEFPLDPSQMVVSTRNGGITEEVFTLGVYNFLQQRYPETAKAMAEDQRKQNQIKLNAYCKAYALEGALWLRLHALRIVSETYPEMDIAPENLSESPRRFGMIARYNNGMRESWMRVIEYLDLEIQDAMMARREKQ